MRRNKVAAWILRHKTTLLAWSSLAQQRDASVPMMVVDVVDEDPLRDTEREVLDAAALCLCSRQCLA
jgi:hypothetical protein